MKRLLVVLAIVIAFAATPAQAQTDVCPPPAEVCAPSYDVRQWLVYVPLVSNEQTHLKSAQIARVWIPIVGSILSNTQFFVWDADWAEQNWGEVREILLNAGWPGEAVPEEYPGGVQAAQDNWEDVVLDGDFGESAAVYFTTAEGPVFGEWVTDPPRGRLDLEDVCVRFDRCMYAALFFNVGMGPNPPAILAYRIHARDTHILFKYVGPP